MKKIVLQDDFAFLYFNREFYLEESIVDAIKVYADFFKAKLSKTKKYFIIKIEKKNKDYELGVLTNEFANYVIAILPKSSLVLN